MDLTGNHTIAVIKGQESYELLQSSCATIFKQVNDLTKKKKVTIDGRDMPVEVFLGGDYKVQSVIIILVDSIFTIHFKFK